jgi:nucleotide-binding universal stress UspA family protein
MRVLMGLSLSTQSIDVVKQTALRPWPAETEFLLLHVLDPFPFAKAPMALRRAKEAAEAQLKESARSLIEAGWKTETNVVVGLPRRVVSEVATSWKADFVVVGSNDAGALIRLFLGSTARSVLRHAPCSVEIVRPSVINNKETQPRDMRIIVATDGSEYAKAAIESVASRPWPRGSMGRVISIPEPYMLLGQFPYFELKEIEKLNAAALEDATRYAQAGAEILSKAGLKATAETPLPRDSDAREIVNEAERWQSELVVLGSHGRRGFDRLTMGSVSEHVAMHAPCSVEVIRVRVTQSTKSRKASRKGAKL